MELTFRVTGGTRYMTCRTFSPDNKKVSMCKINIDTSNGIPKWTISEFFTEKEFMHKGFGKITMKHLVHYLIGIFGVPSDIEYIWNGANQYVFDWITEEFDAVCQCPLAVQKTQTDDDWSSHMYTLNRDKVLQYFK